MLEWFCEISNNFLRFQSLGFYISAYEHSSFGFAPTKSTMGSKMIPWPSRSLFKCAKSCYLVYILSQGVEFDMQSKMSDYWSHLNYFVNIKSLNFCSIVFYVSGFRHDSIGFDNVNLHNQPWITKCLWYPRSEVKVLVKCTKITLSHIIYWFLCMKSIHTSIYSHVRNKIWPKSHNVSALVFIFEKNGNRVLRV